MPNIAIITAAGKGKRMESKVNKILLSLVNKSIIEETIDVFENCKYKISKTVYINKKRIKKSSAL